MRSKGIEGINGKTGANRSEFKDAMYLSLC